MSRLFKTAAGELAAAQTVMAEIEVFLKQGHWRVAARDAYLVALRASHARILKAGMPLPRTHQGVNAAIAALYKDSDFKPASVLSSLERWKNAGDYGHGALPLPAEAIEAVRAAKSYLTRMERDMGPPERPPVAGFMTKTSLKKDAWRRRPSGIGD